MKSDKDIKLYSADDPVTDVEFTGTSVNHIDEDDPATDVDLTGTSLNSLRSDDFIYANRSGNHIDSQCEGDEMENVFNSIFSYQDPLGDVELGDSDDTGICLHYLDSELEQDFDVDVTGRGIAQLLQ